jgi:hypothetical protein
LEDTQGSDTEFGAEDGEEADEELLGEADFGEDEGDELEDDEEAIYDSPEDTSRLVGDGASSAIRER